jgi:hypothetical protein
MTDKRQIGSVEQMEDQAHKQWGTVGGKTNRNPLSAQDPGGSDTQETRTETANGLSLP